ncbi:mechanosensitive ion channel family protein [Vibrio sp. ZSDZ65]|uniref:Mechanosensitive ion channel family protein n=1 Tax=Vibrio qingdaonensis TaxID=2829491 RepID=A0A9X3CLJ5_9VIBR|nr:mechanosensitive ion channel family protein [Vibrio qingdaonensis]MCW8345657.1 mechanosensitive ion channel family protein [Vibrio qingdaonensis]
MIHRDLPHLLLCVFIFLSPLSWSNDDFSLSNTSTAKSTLESFLLSSETLIKYWQEEKLETQHAQHVLAQTKRTMDLTLVPNRNRTVVVMERILLLREILDRIDEEAFFQAPEFIDSHSNEVTQWRFANTDIAIIRQLEGEKAGQYLFSATSIQQLPYWYRAMEVLPYQNLVRSDYYQDFLVNPGPLFSKQFIHQLPTAFNTLYGPLPLWQWVALLVVFSFSKLLIKISFYLGDKFNQRREHKDVTWRVGRLMALLGAVLILFVTRKIIDDGIWITGAIYQFLSTGFLVAQFFYISWMIMATFNYLSVIYAFKKHDGKHIDSSLLTVLARIVGGLTIAMLAIYAVEYMGFSISPILAGIGVSGLAVALAIRPVLENVINGLTLYADGGIKIGELCRYGEKLGTIESIGLRSTRIRTLERSLITIPNSEFANMEIDNLERRDKRRMEHNLRVRTELTQDQLKLLIVNMRRVLLQHPELEVEAVRVRLKGIGEFSIILNVLAYIRCRDNEEFLAVQEDVLFQLMHQMKVVGAQFALSNQYQLVDKLSTVDSELKDKATQTIQKWHETNNYPFPDFSYEYKSDIQNTVMYPTKTSAVRKNTST